MTKGNSAIMNQTIKLFKHTRSGSYATSDRYSVHITKEGTKGDSIRKFEIKETL